jgi:hypothetical protein
MAAGTNREPLTAVQGFKAVVSLDPKEAVIRE